MKKLLYIVAVLLVSFQGFSQDAASLKANAQKYYDITVKLDYTMMMEMIYPKLFDIVPKETMLTTLKKTFEENEGFKVKLMPVAPNFVFGDIKKIGNQSFSVINHDTAFKIIWDEPIPAEEIQSYIDSFKATMNTQDVVYDAPNKTMDIKARSKLIAVADETTNKEWKYLTYSDQIFPMIFNEKIKTELGLGPAAGEAVIQKN